MGDLKLDEDGDDTVELHSPFGRATPGLTPEEASELAWKGRQTPITFLLHPFADLFWEHLQNYLTYEYNSSVNHDFIFQKTNGRPLFAALRKDLNETFKKGSLTNYEKQFLKNKTLEEMTVYTDDQADMVREKQNQFSPSGSSQKRRRYTSKSITPTDGDNTDGDITDGDNTDGDITDGDITDGYITDGYITDGSGGLNDFALAGGQQETANNSKKLLGLTAVLAGGYLLYTYM
jgi:hypothetical protein